MNTEDIEHESFLFIEHHIDASFNEVPEIFFKLWHINIPIEDYLKSDYQNRYEYRIFQYALAKYEQIKQISIPCKHHLDIFRIFQYMLTISLLRRFKFPAEATFKIFDFYLYFELI